MFAVANFLKWHRNVEQTNFTQYYIICSSTTDLKMAAQNGSSLMRLGEAGCLRWQRVAISSHHLPLSFSSLWFKIAWHSEEIDTRMLKHHPVPLLLASLSYLPDLFQKQSEKRKQVSWGRVKWVTMVVLRRKKPTTIASPPSQRKRKWPRVMGWLRELPPC